VWYFSSGACAKRGSVALPDCGDHCNRVDAIS